MSMYSCCICGEAVTMLTITQFGLSPNVCAGPCLQEVNAGTNPPKYLLVKKEDFDSAEDLKNCCDSAMKMNQKEEN